MIRQNGDVTTLPSLWCVCGSRNSGGCQTDTNGTHPRPQNKKKKKRICSKKNKRERAADEETQCLVFCLFFKQNGIKWLGGYIIIMLYMNLQTNEKVVGIRKIAVAKSDGVYFYVGNMMRVRACRFTCIFAHLRDKSDSKVGGGLLKAAHRWVGEMNKYDHRSWIVYFISIYKTCGNSAYNL